MTHCQPFTFAVVGLVDVTPPLATLVWSADGCHFGGGAQGHRYRSQRGPDDGSHNSAGFTHRLHLLGGCHDTRRVETGGGIVGQWVLPVVLLAG